jgi:hypothetical protein
VTTNAGAVIDDEAVVHADSTTSETSLQTCGASTISSNLKNSTNQRINVPGSSIRFRFQDAALEVGSDKSYGYSI